MCGTDAMTRALAASSSILAAAAPSPFTTRSRRSTLVLLSSSSLTLAFSAAAATTPYSQSRTLQLGLDDNGKIRTCPSSNPGCVCTNPTVGASSSVASPLIIPDSTSAQAAAQLETIQNLRYRNDHGMQSLRQAILKTQKNVSFKADQQTPHGQYIEAEVDGGFGRDVMEFLVNKEAGVVAYRCVATKVTFIYPFTTAIGDSRGQEQRIAAIAQDLGWYAPDVSSSIDDVN